MKMELRKKRYSTKEIILFFFLVTLVLAVRLRNILELKGPYIFGDEAGYWSHAANMAGLSWSGVEEWWYSYGYSILLVPLFWITHDMEVLYRMAIIMNALMGVCGFMLGKAIIHDIDDTCGNVISMLISFTASCYSAYIFQSNIAWSETFMYTWFLLIAWSMVKICKKGTWCSLIILSFETAFLYMIHNRCVVIFIAYILTLCFMFLKKKIGWKKVIVAVMILVAMYLVDFFIKSGLSRLAWGYTGGFHGNNLAKQSNKLELFLSLEGWGVLIQSFMGKIWYTFTSTVMLAYLGTIYIIKKIISFIRDKKKNEEDNMLFFFLFLGLFICGSIAVATIVMNRTGITTKIPRLDLLIYGRYHEIINGILIIFGLLYLREKVKKKIRLFEWLIGIIFYLACCGAVDRQIKSMDVFWLNTPCVPGIYFLKDFLFVRICGMVLIIFLVMCIGSCIVSTGMVGRTAKISVYCVFLVVFFSRVSQNAYECHTQMNQRNNEVRIQRFSQILTENMEYTIYCTGMDDYAGADNYDRKLIRTRVVDGVIKNQLPPASENSFFLIVGMEDLEIDLKRDDIYFVEGCGNLALFAVGNELAEKLQSEGFSCNKTDGIRVVSLKMDEIEMSLKGAEKVVGLNDDLFINVGIQNNSNTVFLNNFKYRLSYHIFDAQGNLVLWDNERYEIDDFLSEKIISIVIDADKFGSEGEYMVEIDIVEEGVNWFSYVGGETIKVSVWVESE